MTDPVSFVFARSLNLNFDCGLILKEALSQLGLRGGGSAEFAQGEVPSLQLAALRASLVAAIRSAVPQPR
jgi:alanyl-tRNA synthetase